MKKTKNLGQAFQYVLEKDLPDIVLEITMDIVKNVPKKIWKIILSLGKIILSIVDEILSILEDSLDNGLLETLENRFNKIKNLSEKGKNNLIYVSKVIKEFLKDLLLEIESKSTNEEKTKYVLKISTYILSFGAGALCGYKTPDKDIDLWGIGRHRNYLTHSLLIGLMVYISSRILIRTFDKVDKYLTPDSKDREFLEVLRRNLVLLSGGYITGMSVHLFIDGTIQGGKAMSGLGGAGIGSIISDTLVDDKAFLIVNSLISALMGKDLFEKELKKFKNQSNSLSINKKKVA